MIEVVIALMIATMSFIGLLTIKVPPRISLYKKLSHINYQQTIAMLERHDENIADTTLYFNHMGNINHAMTINYYQYRIIFRLGFGNRRYE